MILKQLIIISGILIFSINTSIAQNPTHKNPAGNWLASCDGPKLKFSDVHEICMITIDTGAFDPGYFAAEFYYAVDYMKNGQATEFECATQHEHWTDFGINLYFSFSYIGSFADNQLNFDGGSGYSVQNDFQLEEQFIQINSQYELMNSNELVLSIGDKQYTFYRMNMEN